MLWRKVALLDKTPSGDDGMPKTWTTDVVGKLLLEGRCQVGQVVCESVVMEGSKRENAGVWWNPRPPREVESHSGGRGILLCACGEIKIEVLVARGEKNAVQRGGVEGGSEASH